MTPTRALALFAHPDDESLLAAGTLAAWAADGVRVTVVSATRGEHGSANGHGALAPDELGRLRERELAEACTILGTGSRVLDFEDGMLASLDPDQLAGSFERVLADERPDVLVTFGPEGLYWHPDHVAVHEAALAAVDAMPRARRPRTQFATMPAGHLDALVEDLAARSEPTDLWGLEPAAFGAPPETIVETVDVRPQLALKLRALRAHRTQIAPGHLFHSLPDDLAEAYLGREFFAA